MLNKRLVVVTLRLIHVSNIYMTCSHVWVAAIPCDGTIQDHLVHAQRLARLHVDVVKEEPCLLAHNPNMVEHSTVCTSATLPSANATAATSKPGPNHQQNAPFARPCCHCAGMSCIPPPDEKRRGFLMSKLAQLRCQHSRQRGHQHGPLRLGRKPVAHDKLCHGVHRRAARVVDRHQRVRLQQEHGLLRLHGPV